MKSLFIVFALFISTTSIAQEQSQSSIMWNDFTSPVTTNAKYITMGGLFAAGLVYLNKSSQTYRKRETYKDAKPFGDYGFIGNYLGLGVLNAMYVGGAFIYAKAYENDDAMEASYHMTKASLYSLGLTFAMKKSIDEKRPGYPEDKDSFPSGHSSGSFSFASVVAARHGWGWGGGAYALASFISFSRINDDYHYLHDVIFGITIGASYGWGTYYNYKSKSKHFVSIIPRRGGLGVAFSTPF